MKKLTAIFAALLLCMSTFAANITAGTKLYLAPGMWDDGSARFAAYFYNGSGNAWADLSALSGTDYYVVEAPSGTWTNVIFCRMNGGTTANDWGNKWNQSGDLVYDGTNNLFTISSWDNQTSGWSTYTAAGGSTSEPVTEPEGGVTYTVTVPSGTNQCYINGEATGNTFVKMTLLADGRYQKRITTAHTGLTYNYYSGASADYVEVTALGNAVSPRAYNGNDNVAAWKAVAAAEDPSDDPAVEPGTGLTYSVTVPEGTPAVYIAGEFNTWSFTAMTKVDDTHYTVTIANATAAHKYKYSCGNDWAYVEMSAESTDVADRSYSENDVVASWKAVPGTTPIVEPTENVTITVELPEGMESVHYYTWNTSGAAAAWPGTSVTAVDGKVTFEIAKGNNLILNEGVDGGLQTADITNITADACYTLNADFSYVACGGSVEPGDGLTYNVTVPEGTPAVYIAGEFNEWSFTAMTKVDDTHYTVTIANATAAHKYKYSCGNDWAYVEMSAESTDVADRTYSENDVVASWKAVPGTTPVVEPGENVTITVELPEGVESVHYYTWNTSGEAAAWPGTSVTAVDGKVTFEIAKGNNLILNEGVAGGAQTADITNITADACYTLNADFSYVACGGSVEPGDGLTYSVTVPEGTPAVYIAGEFNSWSFTAMTKVDDTHYTVTIANATSAHKYKYTCGNDWAYVEMSAESTDVADRTYSENDVVASWKSVPGTTPVVEPGENVTITVELPEGMESVHYYTWNTSGAAAAWPGTSVTAVDGKVTFEIAKGNNLILNEGVDGGLQTADITNITADACYTLNADFSYVACGGSVEPGDGLTYSVTVPEGTPAVYIAGEFNEWSFVAMTKVDDTHYTVTIANATSAHKYKYSCGNDWAYVEMSAESTDVADRSYSENDVVASWKSVPGTTPIVEPGENVTITVELPEGMESVHYYTWNTSGAAAAWPGTSVTAVDGKVTFEIAKGNNLILNEGVDGGAQTADITNITADACYTLNADFSYVACGGSVEPGDGLTYSVTVPEGTPAVYIAGEFNEWSFTAMTKVDDTHYTVTIANATAAHKYKYSCGNDWAYVEMSAESIDIADRTYSENDVVASWKSVPGTTPIVEPGENVTITVELPEGMESVHYYTWNTSGEAAAWPGTSVTAVDGKVTFEIAKGNNLILNEGVDGGLQTADITNITADACYTLNADFSYVACGGSVEPGEGLTYNVTVPEGTPAVYIAGEFNEWSFVAMTKVDDTHYTVTIANATSAHKYKYSCGNDWAYVEMSAESTDIADRSYSENDVVASWKSVPGTTPIVEPGENVTITVELPEGMESVHYYTWNTSGEAAAWPGTSVTAVDGKVTFEIAKGNNLILNEGVDGGAQTADITNITADACYTLNADFSYVACGGSVEPGDGLTYNVTVPEGTPAVYIAGEFNTWSFTAMTKVDDTHYTVTIANATAAHGYKYTCGEGWDYVEMSAESTDVADRSYSENDVVASWKSVPGTTPIVEPTENVTITVELPEGMESVHYYTWNTSGAAAAWPGTSVTAVDGKVTFEIAKGNNLILNEGVDGGAQTADITNITADACYTLNADFSYVACGGSVEPGDGLTYNVTVPEGTPAVYIAGEFNTWTFTAMTKVDDTHYTVTIANATAAHGYKYTCGEGWDYVEMSAESTDVADRSYSENDVVASWKKIPSGNITYGLTYSVTVPEGTPAVYICGGWDWNTFILMTKVDDTHYTVTIDEASSDNAYKYTCGDNWAFVEVDADGNNIADRSYSENDVVARWLDIPQEPVVVEGYYVAGTIVESGWELPHVAMTNGVYTVTLPAGSYEFKVTGNDWALPAYGCNDLGTVTGITAACNEGGDNIAFTTTEEMSLTISFDGKHVNIVATATGTEPQPGENVTITVELPEGMENVHYYTWNTSGEAAAWPGTSVTAVDGKVTFEIAKGNNLILNDGVEGGAQTADITNITADACYTLNADFSYVACGGSVEPGDGLTYNVTVPEGTPAVYIAGEFNTWSFTAMTKVDDTHYTVTIANATAAHKYKYTCGNDWAYVEMSAEGTDVADRSYSENDVVERWNKIPSSDLQVGLTFNVTVPEGTPAVYICGGWDWNTFVPMTKVDDTHYTITIAEANSDHGYKYTCGEGWIYEEEGHTANRSYSENDVVTGWKQIPTGLNTVSVTSYTIANRTLSVTLNGRQNIALYDVAGRMIQNAVVADFYQVELPVGIYILRAANTSIKVAIR